MKKNRSPSFRPTLEMLEDRLALSGGLGNPGIVPPHAHPYGHTYGQWSARWWQWAYSLPVNHHPLTDTADVSTGQSGHVWFLGASFAPTPPNPVTGQIDSIVTRDATIPAGKALFFPVVNAEASTLEGNGTTEAELRAAAVSFQDAAMNMSAQIDGRAVNHLAAYRVQSPLFTFGPLPDNNVLQSFGVTAPAGATSLSVGDGVYLMVAPLSVGRHTIHFHGELPIASFLLDVTYNLTVVARHEDPDVDFCRVPASGSTNSNSQTVADRLTLGLDHTNPGWNNTFASIPATTAPTNAGNPRVAANSHSPGNTADNALFLSPWANGPFSVL